MKTYRNLYPQVWDFENLYLAYRKARQGKRGKPYVAAFERRQEEELFALQDDLRQKTYQPGEYHSFFLCACQALFPALLGGGVRLASYLNYIPLFPNSYTTTQDYALFWSEIVIQAFSSSFVTFMMVFVAWMGAQTLAKLVWPRQDRILERGPARWLKFSLSAWRGLLISGVHLGYVVTFYLLTSRFLGWWSPIGQGSASNIYATPLPFIEALDVGVNAAFIEELLFRLAGISLVLWQKLNRYYLKAHIHLTPFDRCLFFPQCGRSSVRIGGSRIPCP